MWQVSNLQLDSSVIQIVQSDVLRNSVDTTAAITNTHGVRGKCHGNFRGCPTTAISTAIRGHCHGNPPIRGNYHESPRQLPRQFPRTSIHSNFHGHPRPLPRQSSDARQLPRKSAAIATAISADVKPQQFPRPSAAILRYTAIATEVHHSCHRKFYGIARPSAAIESPR